MKALIITLSFIIAFLLLYKEKMHDAVKAPKGDKREIDSGAGNSSAPFNPKWFNKDLNSCVNRNFGIEKGC